MRQIILDTETTGLETADGHSLPAQVSLASVTRPGRGYWIEVYGSEGTLVLGSSNQSDYVHGFQLWQSRAGGPLEELAPDLSARRVRRVDVDVPQLVQEVRRLRRENPNARVIVTGCAVQTGYGRP